MNSPSLEAAPPATMAPAFALALAANFGSVQRWRTEFAALAAATLSAGAAPGTVELCFDAQRGTLANRVATAGAAAHEPPLLQLTLTDSTSPAAISAAIDRIDWPAVYERYQHVVHDASEALGIDAGDIERRPLVDVRRAGVYAAAQALIAEATWRDPAAVSAWAAELPRDKEVVVYCVYGHEVGRATALRLQAAGVKARFLRGGFDGWQAEGRALQPKPDPST